MYIHVMRISVYMVVCAYVYMYNVGTCIHSHKHIERGDHKHIERGREGGSPRQRCKVMDGRSAGKV